MEAASTLSTLTSPSSAPSCFTRVKESKLTDVTLVTGFVALLIIGILATTGVFQFMGAANAAFLSYGMYGGASLFLIAEVIKLAVTLCKKKSESGQKKTNKGPGKSLALPSFRELTQERIEKQRIKKIVDGKIEKMTVNFVSVKGKYSCSITLADTRVVTVDLAREQICALAGAVSSTKMDWESSTKSSSAPSFSYHFQPSGAWGWTATKVFDEVIQPEIEKL